MKKITLFLVFIILIQFLTNCKKNDPITPALVDTATITQTWTISETHTVSPTISPTGTNTLTATNTPTNTPLPTIDSSILISVPGGTFTQQSDENNDGDVLDPNESFSHTISAFKIGKYEVAYDLWYTVYQWAISNGYAFASAGREGRNGMIGAVPTAAKYEPVTTISWRDVIVWCNAYSQMMGLTPVYCSDAGLTTPIKDSTDGAYGGYVNTDPGSFDNPYVNWSANGYRLPTEGEWEYAARYINGSSWTPYNYASGAAADYYNAAATGLVAWYAANSGNDTHDVGGKTANVLDICDMSGNVIEWCWDWLDIYPGTSTNYRGPASPVSGFYHRVRRGGQFGNSAFLMQAGNRDYGYSYDEFISVGFRLARTQ